MKYLEGFFKGVRNASIYYQGWLPDTDPKAVLLIVNGLAEHSGRYMNMVNHLVPSGYAVYGMDHIGHGKSDGIKVYVERFEDFTETLKTYFNMVKAWQPDKPVFLVGHSMGGLIAAAFLIDHQSDLAGAVLSGPSITVPDNISPAVIVIGRLFSALMPRFRLIKLDAENVSRDPEVVMAYKNDPMVYTGKITARLGAELLKAMQRVSAEATNITLPVLILQGGADRMVSPDGARMLYNTIGSTDKVINIYDGLYHEVYNEPEHDAVLCDVETWLEDRLSKG
ncbi:MAG: lysophospholipase [Syntrophales bacterium]|nr:lysophospholipase [Syntrophales bacterium]